MKHVEALDGLRAVAVLIVMFSHAGLGNVVPGGLGVTIFFFLSGFLITTLMRVEIERTGRLSFRGFYLRRTVRIIPPMLLCIAATVCLSQLGLIGREIDLRLIWTDLLFLTNYASAFVGTSNLPIPLWSLDVEEHFYLLFPLIFVALSARSANAAIAGVLLGIFLALLARIWTVIQLQDTYNVFYWSHTRIDSILYGCLLALFNNPLTQDRVRFGPARTWFVLGALILVGTLVVRDPVFRETLRYSLHGIALFLMFNFILRTDGLVNRMLSAPALRPIGNWSYVLYLIHMPLFLVAESWFGVGAIAYAVGFLLSFAFAASTFRFVEQPLFQWRKRFQERFRVPVGMEPKGVE